MGGVEFTTGRGDTFIVDPADVERIRPYTWLSVANRAGHKERAPYIQANIGGRRVYLHRFLTDAPEGFAVDHIDGDSLNNCRANLRVVTQTENVRFGVKRRLDSGL